MAFAQMSNRIVILIVVIATSHVQDLQKRDGNVAQEIVQTPTPDLLMNTIVVVVILLVVNHRVVLADIAYRRRKM